MKNLAPPGWTQSRLSDNVAVLAHESGKALVVRIEFVVCRLRFVVVRANGHRTECFKLAVACRLALA